MSGDVPDIVTRLRNWNRDGVPTAITPHMMMREAANYIEGLRRELRERERNARRDSPDWGEHG